MSDLGSPEDHGDTGRRGGGALRFPDVRDGRVGAVTMIPRFTRDPDTQRHVVAEVSDAWAAAWLPDGLVSATLFASDDGASVLSYVQWTRLAALRGLDPDPAADAGARAFGSAWSTVYRRERSLVAEGPAPTPTALVCASFDVDGHERQRYLVDALVELAASLPPVAGAVAAHFHLSLDGTRVVNYTEWSDADEHDEEAEAGTYDAIYRVSNSTPGVRSLRGNRYRLVAAVRRG